jgi:hypothetical protein
MFDLRARSGAKEQKTGEFPASIFVLRHNEHFCRGSYVPALIQVAVLS